MPRIAANRATSCCEPVVEMCDPCSTPTLKCEIRANMGLQCFEPNGTVDVIVSARCATIRAFNLSAGDTITAETMWTGPCGNMRFAAYQHCDAAGPWEIAFPVTSCNLPAGRFRLTLNSANADVCIERVPC